MTPEEQFVYADFIMGMRQRGMEEYDGDDFIPENQLAEDFYGPKYTAIREDFVSRLDEQLKEQHSRNL